MRFVSGNLKKEENKTGSSWLKGTLMASCLVLRHAVLDVKKWINKQERDKKTHACVCHRCRKSGSKVWSVRCAFLLIFLLQCQGKPWGSLVFNENIHFWFRWKERSLPSWLHVYMCTYAAELFKSSVSWEKSRELSYLVCRCPILSRRLEPCCFWWWSKVIWGHQISNTENFVNTLYLKMRIREIFELAFAYQLEEHCRLWLHDVKGHLKSPEVKQWKLC